MKPILSIRNLNKSYGKIKIFENMNFEVNKGDVISIRGDNGSGKTTLLKIINMLEFFEKGTIDFDNSKLKMTSNNIETRRKMLMIFQKPVLFNTSVAKNIAFGLKIRGFSKEGVDEIVSESLEIVKMSHKSEENALTLSGGEMQRVVLATAYALKPKLLLLDEPNSNLDSENLKIAESMLKKINKIHKTTIILSTHDRIHESNLCNKSYVIQNHKLTKVK